MSKPPPPISDYQLAVRVLEGDPRGFELLYQRHAPIIGRRLRRLVRQREDADDLLQAVFYEAHRSLARFRPEASFEGWLHAIAFRLVGNHIKASRRKWWQVFSPDAADEIGTAQAPDLAAQAESRQQISRLYAVLDTLPPQKRIAFCLHELEGVELAEIGRLMGTSAQTIWARVESVRKELLKHLHRDQSGENAE